MAVGESHRVMLLGCRRLAVWSGATFCSSAETTSAIWLTKALVDDTGAVKSADRCSASSNAAVLMDLSEMLSRLVFMDLSEILPRLVLMDLSEILPRLVLMDLSEILPRLVLMDLSEILP